VSFTFIHDLCSPKAFLGTTRHVHHEIQAALDHLLFHPNTAPFVALRFIQRFGVSNPSPGYIARVVKSFTSGTYIFSEPSSEPIAFGSGDYGDLSAMIASILMDRESRSALLDVDPFHGSFREPLIKVISLMRNLEYESYDKFVSFGRMKTLIGQMVSCCSAIPFITKNLPSLTCYNYLRRMLSPPSFPFSFLNFLRKDQCQRLL
jgi:uncharacterized protein (DUF1800 family)